MDIRAKIEYAVDNAKPIIVAMYDMISSLERISANMDADLFESFAQLVLGFLDHLIQIYRRRLLEENVCNAHL